ncbi:Glu/Leu/Phe/Val dehydrogenase dimerization domain-containing protein [Janibacter terrae]|uniref:Glu/Leu/Phe/Val dehydrogenase dimerization domain-containing protein n=1 Tax=Janibacter terrae TaxID=103817 RepID=UPI003829C9A1
MTLTHSTDPSHAFVDRAPAHEVTWVDPVTGAHGYLVVHTLVCGIATGGTRMRPGCTRDEVADLARGMATKTAAFGLPVGGAKGGIDFDPKDPRAFGVLSRFFDAMRPWLDGHWVTAEDLGVTQQLIDDVFEEIGLSQSFHAAITRSPDPEATLERVHAGLAVMTDGLPLGDIIGGYGVAQACLGVAEGFDWAVPETEVTIQGIGTMGGGAAWYLHEAGARVTAIADARGTLVDPAGLDIPTLLDLRDQYGEIDRSRVPSHVQQLDRDAILQITADVFVPAAVSYAIREDNVEGVAARVVVEAANAATTWRAEDTLTARGIPVVPDFIANTGAAAWAWWLLQGQVGTDPQDSFRRLSTEMRSKVAVLARAWRQEGTPMRDTAFALAATNLRLLEGAQIVIP